jgi:hypothetical protein
MNPDDMNPASEDEVVMPEVEETDFPSNPEGETEGADSEFDEE